MMNRNRRPISLGRCAAATLSLIVLLYSINSLAETVPPRGVVDSRIRVAVYSGDEVYKLRGFVGYQIDLEFEPGETFTGLGAGDLEGLSFVGQDNHLFLKPKAARVATNLTVLTSRRHYQFDYAALSQRPLPDDPGVIYAVRFTYPPTPAQSTADAAAKGVDSEFMNASNERSRNIDYWYCGAPALRPVAASDDSVHTRLRFAANADLPAVFVRNEDGSESLLNFSMDGGDVILHRLARQFILRRGKLQGCVVNKGFAGGGIRLKSGTVAPGVERQVRGAASTIERQEQGGVPAVERQERGGHAMSEAGSTRTSEVSGERDTTAVNRAPTVQSRISSVLAIGLMSLLGLGVLTWYYANAFTRQSRARQSAQTSSASRAQGEMPLPSLGRIDPPARDFASAERTEEQKELPREPGEPAPPAPLIGTALREIPLQVSPAGAAYGSPQPKSTEQLTMERQLSGVVFSAQSQLPVTVAEAGVLPPPAVAAQQPGELSALLRPAVSAAVRAQVLPTQRLLLAKGAFIDCTLETAIDSTLPGMTTCVMATDAFGVDGQVVLLERGTKLIGETRGQVQQGSARVFVLWTEARTPTGVVVPLDSPGADELGRSGLPGAVNNHFWERFGAAILVSVIDGTAEGAVQSSRGGSGTVIVNPSATQEVMTEVLKGTVNIPPTVVKQQGDRIQVLVARDPRF